MPRLDKLLARNLLASRKEITQLLRQGRVCAEDGTPLRDGGLDVRPGPDGTAVVRLDDQALVLRDAFHLLLNKPAGYVTALRDDHNPIATALIQDAPLWPELRAVGRLDKETTGLLLWTTDGQWLHRLIHPKNAVPRTYHAALARPPLPMPEQLVLDDGHTPHILSMTDLSSEATHPALVAAPEAQTYAAITIVGGAYHEVRRIFAALGSHVLSLCRVAYGTHTLPADLPHGAWIEVAGPAAAATGRG